MKPLLRITPLHKKSVEMTYEIYAVDGNDPPRSWIVTEQYRAGRGFMELEDFDLDLFDSDSVICSTKFSEDPQLEIVTAIYLSSAMGLWLLKKSASCKTGFMAMRILIQGLDGLIPLLISGQLMMSI